MFPRLFFMEALFCLCPPTVIDRKPGIMVKCKRSISEFIWSGRFILP